MFVDLIKENFEFHITNIMMQQNTSILPVMTQKLSIRDYSCVRELFDGRVAVLGCIETKILVTAPCFNALFGVDASLWTTRTMLVDIAVNKDGSFELLPESSGDNLGNGFNHSISVDSVKQSMTTRLDSEDFKLSERLEFLFSYEDHLAEVKRIKDVRSILSKDDLDHILNQAQIEAA